MAEHTRVAKSLLRLDALARGGGAGGLEGGMSVHRSALCPGWETLAADGALAVPLDNNAVARPRGPQLLRVNHYIDLGSNRSRCEEELGRPGAVWYGTIPYSRVE